MNIYTHSDDLKVCRVCLSTDTKLFDLHKHGLISTYFEFTGTPISTCDGLPQELCTFCCAMLRKSSEFRNKCRDTHTFLLNNLLQYHCLTTSLLDSIERSHLKIPLTLSEVNIESYPYLPEDILNMVKEEIQIDLDEKDPILPEFYDENDDGYSNEDLSFNNVKPESEFANFINKHKKKSKTKHKKEKDKLCEDNIKQFKDKYVNAAIGHKKEFYEFILKRYIQKTDSIPNRNDIKTEQFLSLDNNTENVDLTKKLSEKTTANQKQFYKYIINKYGNIVKKKTTKKKVTDFTRMREKKVRKGARNRTEEELAVFAKTYNVVVEVLSTEEQIVDVLSRKETEKFKKAQFQCDQCCRGFTVQKAFQNHIAIHDPSAGAYECEVCHVRFTKKGRLTKHVQMRHKFKFSCKLCSQITRNSTCAREHYKCHAGHKYICEHCGKIFSKYGSRINHIRIFHGSVACNVCQERFAGEAGLIAHKTKAHRELYKCVTCGVQFHNPDALTKHSVLLLGEACGAHIRPCTQCGDNFLNEEAVIQHNLEFHNKQKNSHRLQQKSVKLPSDQKPNVRWLARKTPRPPDDVLPERERAFKKKIGAEPQKFMCEMCAADGFASEAVLRYHQRIHTGEKPHPCPQCPKRFRIRELLQKHIRTHTGDRPYKCAHCPKAFKTASAHYTHQVVHTKIRRHRCHLCDKMFLTSTCVKTHIKSVHMKLPAPPRARRRPPADVTHYHTNHIAGY